MSYSANFAGYTSFLLQSALGTPAAGAGGTILRQTGGTPGKLSKAAIQSKEIRQDAQQTKGRHGMQTSVGGPYNTELSIGSVDAIIQAIMRGTWDSEITKTQSDFTSITTGAHTIIMSSGNPITMGFRVNDVIEATGLTDAANNAKNLRITGLSATTITVAETLVVNATPDTTCSIIRRGRKVINPAAGSLVNRYFTVEEWQSDLLASRVFPDCFWKSAKLAMAPNGIISFDPSWVGTGAMSVNNTGTPILTTPTLPTTAPLAALDSTLRFGGVDVADIVSWDLTIDNGAVAPAVVGSKVSPTVMPGLNQISLNISLLQKDMSYVTAHLNETGFSLSLLTVPNMAELKDFISINVPNFSLGSDDISPMSTAGGARTQQISVPIALVGHDGLSGTGFDDTTCSIQISNLS